MTPSSPREMHLAAYAPAAGAGFSSYAHLARTAERGLFDFLLVDEVLRLPENENENENEGENEREGEGAAGGPEPLTVLAALAAVTDRLGLAAAAHTAFHEPYELARRLATLDHLSAGRAAWHAVAPADPLAGANFRRGAHPDRAEGHPRAAEFLAAARALWDSWTPDGTPRPVAHHGRHFSVEGEFTVERCPQGHPVVLHAGDSPEGLELAAAEADIVLTPHTTLGAARALYAEVKGRLGAHGRAHDALKVMPRVAVALDGTGARPARSAGQEPFTGSPDTVAALLTEYVTERAADGFVLVPPPAPGGLDDFVDRVVPLLQERGVLRRTYTGTTLRSHLRIAERVWKG